MLFRSRGTRTWEDGTAPDALARLRAIKALLEQHSVFVSLRCGCLRVSCHVYTTESDLDRLEAALGEAGQAGLLLPLSS